MVTLTELWLPVLLSAVFVFIVSSIIHMVLPIHRGDCAKLSGEEKLLDALRAQGLRPGTYMFPFPSSMKEMGSPEMMERYKQGPVGILTMLPNAPPVLGKHLIQWFLYSILVGFFVAYLASISLGRESDYMAVFRFTGTAAILGYALGDIPDSVWHGRSWSTTLKFAIDGVVYGLVTAGTFGWLWPAGA